MGKINSKAKGTRFERELARTFRDYGYTGSVEPHSIVEIRAMLPMLSGCQAFMLRLSIRKNVFIRLGGAGKA